MADARLIVDALGTFPDALQRFSTIRLQRGSPASSDGRRLIGRYAWQLGALKLAAAGDHLESWRRIVIGGSLPTFSQYSLLRSAHETASTARWLVDPDAAQPIRIARGVGCQQWDYDERRKFEQAASGSTGRARPPSTSGKSAVERLAELEREADKARMRGIQVNLVSIAREYGAPRQAPPGTGEVLYRLLSSFVHGTQWSVLPMSEREDIGADDRFGTRTMSITANVKMTAYATKLVVDVYAAAVEELARYAAPR